MKASYCLVIVCCLLAAAVTHAQQKPLTSTDVKRFCDSFPSLLPRMEHLGLDFDSVTGTVDIPDALRTSASFKQELATRGWGPEFFGVMQKVIRGYAALNAQQGEIQKGKEALVLERIKSIEGIPDNLRQEMLQQAQAAMKGSDAAARNLRQSVPPSHLNAVQSQVNSVTGALDPQPQP